MSSLLYVYFTLRNFRGKLLVDSIQFDWESTEQLLLHTDLTI